MAALSRHKKHNCDYYAAQFDKAGNKSHELENFLTR